MVLVDYVHSLTWIMYFLDTHSFHFELQNKVFPMDGLLLLMSMVSYQSLNISSISELQPMSNFCSVVSS